MVAKPEVHIADLPAHGRWLTMNLAAMTASLSKDGTTVEGTGDGRPASKPSSARIPSQKAGGNVQITVGGDRSIVKVALDPSTSPPADYLWCAISPSPRPVAGTTHIIVVG